jgi:hypothetical protein
MLFITSCPFDNSLCQSHQIIVCRKRCRSFTQRFWNSFIFNPLNAELNPICHLLILLGDLTFMGPCIVSIFQYISNKMQRYTVYLSGNCSTCFGWYFYPSSGAHTTVSTTSGICHTVTAICLYCGKVGTGLSVFKPVPTPPR